MKAIKKQS